MTLVAEAPRTTDLEAIFGLCPKRRRRDLVKIIQERIMQAGMFHLGAIENADTASLIEIAGITAELDAALKRYCAV